MTSWQIALSLSLSVRMSVSLSPFLSFFLDVGWCEVTSVIRTGYMDDAMLCGADQLRAVQ